MEFRPSEDSLATNLANWNSRVPHHVAEYGLEHFRDDPAHLSSVVRFDLPRLGDLTGLDVVHLQCHIGSYTVSLARLGARSVTGLDFSAPALEAARRLAGDAGTDVRFVQADVYSALDVLPAASFDLVFTGIGALCWLPSVSRWAEIVATLLRRDGRLFIREGHPMLWTLSDPRPDGLLVVEYPYFETAAGTEFHEELSYTPQSEPLTSPTTREWNHGIGEIFSAIAAAGLHIDAFEEHMSVPWNPLGEAMVETDLGGVGPPRPPRATAADLHAASNPVSRADSNVSQLHTTAAHALTHGTYPAIAQARPLKLEWLRQRRRSSRTGAAHPSSLSASRAPATVRRTTQIWRGAQAPGGPLLSAQAAPLSKDAAVEAQYNAGISCMLAAG